MKFSKFMFLALLLTLGACSESYLLIVTTAKTPQPEVVSVHRSRDECHLASLEIEDRHMMFEKHRLGLPGESVPFSLACVIGESAP
jgi:hypothetical protein